MTIRPLHFPADLIPLSRMLPESFQYPENDSWSVQGDEKQDLVSTLRSLRRIWPLIRALQLLSPPLRDSLRGYAWVEQGELAGVSMIQRRGASDSWMIGTVGVLPAYRRRGIARQLVLTSLEDIRKSGGRRVFLEVIDGNLPAQALYQSLGFEAFGGSVELLSYPGEGLEAPALPEGYHQIPAGCYDWQARYELERRITPEQVARYEPPEIERYRQSGLTRLLGKLLTATQGNREKCLALQAADGSIAALARYTTSRRKKGVNHFRAVVDPEHPRAALYLVRYVLHQLSAANPGLRLELTVPAWMESVVSAAEEAGFDRRVAYLRMGLLV